MFQKGIIAGISTYQLWVLCVMQYVKPGEVPCMQELLTAIGKLCDLLLWFVISQAITQEVFYATDYS